jgi:hypothetical protein
VQVPRTRDFQDAAPVLGPYPCRRNNPQAMPRLMHQLLQSFDTF